MMERKIFLLVNEYYLFAHEYKSLEGSLIQLQIA